MRLMAGRHVDRDVLVGLDLNLVAGGEERVEADDQVWMSLEVSSCQDQPTPC